MHEDLGFSPAKQGHKVKDQESQRVDLEIFQIHFFLLMQKNKFFSETQIFAWNESFFSELLITVKVLFFFTRYITSCEWWRREICIFAQLSQLRAIPHPCIHYTHMGFLAHTSWRSVLGRSKTLRFTCSEKATTTHCDKKALLSRCLKITERVSFNIASEASYIYIS